MFQTGTTLLSKAQKDILGKVFKFFTIITVNKNYFKTIL